MRCAGRSLLHRRFRGPIRPQIVERAAVTVTAARSLEDRRKDPTVHDTLATTHPDSEQSVDRPVPATRPTRPVGVLRRAGTIRPRRVLLDDRGSATAEYAIVILAAVAFAGVLVAVMRSGEVQSMLTELVRGALSL